MKVVKEFSRFAQEYAKYNIIQRDVAKKLCMKLDKKNYNNILDVGAGNGTIYDCFLRENINFSSFTALDVSQEMLNIHRSSSNIKKVCLDFNKKGFTSLFKDNHFSLLISSSALQWSSNINTVLEELSTLADNYILSFFTANTFKTLHQTVNIESPICEKKEILNALDMFFIYEFEILEYKLKFNSVHEMLQYIKKSGVSGGVEQLGYKEIKSLFLNYPLEYLEFEVILVKAIHKSK